MKLKTIKYLGLGLAVAVGLTAAANASIVYYTWVPGNAPEDSIVAGSGTLELNGTTVVSLKFTDGSDGTWTGGYIGLAGTLLDGDAVLFGTSAGPNSIGLSYPFGGYVPLTWSVNASPTSPNEQNVQDTVGLSGDWVPTAVPEPTTMISGALLLLPFGASTLRILRKNRAV